MTSHYDEPFANADVLDAAPPRWSVLASPAARRARLLGVALVALACVTGERFLVAPVAAERDTLREAHESLAAKNAEHEATLVGYREFLVAKAETDRRFQEAIAAIPTEAEAASILSAVRDLATEHRLHLVRFAPAAGAPATAGALARFAATAALRGSYDDLEAFFAAVARHPRLLTVENFNASSSAVSGVALDATVGFTCYFKELPRTEPAR